MIPGGGGNPGNVGGADNVSGLVGPGVGNVDNVGSAGPIEGLAKEAGLTDAVKVLPAPGLSATTF